MNTVPLSARNPQQGRRGKALQALETFFLVNFFPMPHSSQCISSQCIFSVHFLSMICSSQRFSSQWSARDVLVREFLLNASAHVRVRTPCRHGEARRCRRWKRSSPPAWTIRTQPSGLGRSFVFPSAIFPRSKATVAFLVDFFDSCYM